MGKAKRQPAAALCGRTIAARSVPATQAGSFVLLSAPSLFPTGASQARNFPNNSSHFPHLLLEGSSDPIISNVVR